MILWSDAMPRANQAFVTRSEDETHALAERLGAELEGREVVLLEGELGAGKTVFTRGLAAGLGLADPGEVCSPSFTLVNIYQGRVPIFHMDLYRLGTKADVYDLGWEDFLGRGVIVVEWGERMDYEDDAVRVLIGVEPNGDRRITISGPVDILW